MAFKHAKNVGVKWNSFDITPYLDKASIQRMANLAETTTFSSSSAAVYKTRVVGVVDVEIDLSGPYDPALEATAGMETDAMAGTARTIKWQLDSTATASATNPAYSFTAVLDGFKGPEGSVGGAVTWSCKAVLTSGVLTRSTSGAF